jgi:hypothetical protein
MYNFGFSFSREYNVRRNTAKASDPESLKDTQKVVDEYCVFHSTVTWGSGSIWLWNVKSCCVVEVYRRFENSAAYIVYPLKRLYTYTITRHISKDIIPNFKAGLL